MDEEQQSLLPLFTPTLLDSIPIYSIVLDQYDLLASKVDTSLKYEQLKSPQIHSFLIKPLTADLKSNLSPGTLYALFANMLQFQKESSQTPAMSGVMTTRAMMCEILAVKLLKDYTDADDLLNAITYDFFPLANGEAGRSIIPRWQRISALELAIKTEAKKFLAHPVVVNILEKIWNGEVMFQSSMHKLHRVRFQNEEDALSRGLGRRGPGIRYRYEDASVFKLSRLRVPRYRHWLNLASFCGLLCLYVMVLSRQTKGFSVTELVFWLWSLGFILDELVGFSDAGFTLYVMSLWNWFDLIILLLLCSYAGTLLASVIDVKHGSRLSSLARDFLGTIAIFLFPRLFSVLDSYELFSYMVISFRKMCIDLAIACFMVVVLSSGFWVAFTMAFARDVFSAEKVAYDMMKILFGFTPTVWDTWEYYSILGRVAIVFYLFITHFVILTILIAILSNSFSSITANAHEEHQYLFAVNTVTLIKSESSSLFSYAPPLNLLEWIVRPLYYFMPLRDFLVLNRTIIKLTHLPVLLLIYAYEKIQLRNERMRERKEHESEASRRLGVNKRTLRTNLSDIGNTGPSGSSTPRRLRKLAKSRDHKTRNVAKNRVSNYDLLDEVYRRPYEGTLGMHPSIKLAHSSKNANLDEQSSSAPFARALAMDVHSDPENYDSIIPMGHDADSENGFGDDDDESLMASAQTTLRRASATTTLDRGTSGSRKRSSSDITVRRDFGKRQISHGNRLRLFSTTSSIARQGLGILSLSPTRSTASVFESQIWQSQYSQPRVRKRTFASTSASRMNNMRDDDMDGDLGLVAEGNSPPSDEDIYKAEGQTYVADEIQAMSRLVMRRMDTIEDGLKNLELMVSRMCTATQT